MLQFNESLNVTTMQYTPREKGKHHNKSIFSLESIKSVPPEHDFAAARIVFTKHDDVDVRVGSCAAHIARVSGDCVGYSCR